MTHSEICERLGDATTWEMVKSEFGGKARHAILAMLNEMFPGDDNSELASDIYFEVGD